MKKTILILVLLSLFSMLLAGPQLKKIINQSKSAVVYVGIIGSDGKEFGQGSGFFMDERAYVATNLHVIYDADDVTVKTASGKVYRIKNVICTDVESDLVVFSLKGISETQNFLTVSNNLPEVGDEIIAVGNPMGLEQTVSNGIISAKRNLPDFGDVYQITAPVSPGSSGGPVMNYDGNLVGVVRLQYKEGQNLNFIVPVSKLAKLLKKPRVMAFAEWKKSGLSTVPDSASGMISLGYLYFSNKDYKKALECAAIAIKKEPKSAKGYYLAGQSSYALENYEYAFKAMKYAATLDEKMQSVHNDLGVMYYKLNMNGDATEQYFLEIEKFPSNSDPYYNLATMYEESGSIDDAITTLRQGMINCDETSSLHSRMGFIYISTGEMDNAINEFNTAVKIDRKNAEAYYGMGVAYYRNEDKDNALKIYEKLKVIDSKLAKELFKAMYN